MTKTHPLMLRPVRTSDQAGVIALIDRVYGEYHDRVNLEGAEQDLTDLHSAYEAQGGAFVVLEAELPEGLCIVGCHGVLPTAPQTGTFRRLYLDARFRGDGTGAQLMWWAIDRAQASGWKRIVFWSDSRFARAHRFFPKFGFAQTGRVREMHDGHIPYSEFEFELQLSSLEMSR
jgi:putative acetyltransferase